MLLRADKQKLPKLSQPPSLPLTHSLTHSPTYPERQRCWPAGWASCASGRRTSRRWWRWCSSLRVQSAAGKRTPPCLRTESLSMSHLHWCWTWQGQSHSLTLSFIKHGQPGPVSQVLLLAKILFNNRVSFIGHILWFDNTEERGKYHQHLFNMGVIQRWTSYVNIWIQKVITRLLRKGSGWALNGRWIIMQRNKLSLCVNEAKCFYCVSLPLLPFFSFVT